MLSIIIVNFQILTYRSMSITSKIQQSYSIITTKSVYVIRSPIITSHSFSMIISSIITYHSISVNTCPITTTHSVSVIRCPVITTPIYSTMKCNMGILEHSVCNITCMPGYHLTTHNRVHEDIASVHCQNSGVWSEVIPSCISLFPHKPNTNIHQKYLKYI